MRCCHADVRDALPVWHSRAHARCTMYLFGVHQRMGDVAGEVGAFAQMASVPGQACVEALAPDGRQHTCTTAGRTLRMIFDNTAAFETVYPDAWRDGTLCVSCPAAPYVCSSTWGRAVEEEALLRKPGSVHHLRAAPLVLVPQPHVVDALHAQHLALRNLHEALGHHRQDGHGSTASWSDWQPTASWTACIISAA